MSADKARPDQGIPPVIGLGASAGGLEALTSFFSAVSPESGAVYVVVQHLDPTHAAMLAELLQRVTALPVVEAAESMTIAPDRVYVIPPNRDLSIQGDQLHIGEPTVARGFRLPIDLFLRSLAAREQLAVAVILSGMGSDGTAGAREVKTAGGLVLVQDPTTAAYSSMPRSAIDAEVADLVLPPGAMPAKILAWLQRPPSSARLLQQPPIRSSIDDVVQLLRAQTGHDFALYRATTLYRRIERRMRIHQMPTSEDYVTFLRGNRAEVELLFKEMLIGVTSFFRDPEAWAMLAGEALPTLVGRLATGGTLRAWVAGCSTGEEAYSLAIAFAEEVAQSGLSCRLQLFATDLDPDAIDRARRGVFRANIAADVSAERLARFFIAEGSSFRIRKEIRDTVIFAPQSVTKDPPFTRLDLVCCRNLLIYLEPLLQRRLIRLFHYSLNSGGLLFLGGAEAVASASDLFSPLRGPAKIYRRRDVRTPKEPISFTAADDTSRDSPRATINLEGEVEKLLVRRYAPTVVLVSEGGDILYCSGQTGRYLEPAAGKANWNVVAMARPGLATPLAQALHQVRSRRDAVTLQAVRIATEVGERAVDIALEPLDRPAALEGSVLIDFSEPDSAPNPLADGSPRPPPSESLLLVRAHEEAEFLRNELQTMREDRQTAQEEMMSSNEELQSINEELQSTNEELTTSREEMQSINEELQLVNDELASKVDELSRASDDMHNLLESTAIATVFLDEALNVRSFTAQATKHVRLIPSDVGRPFSDIASTLVYPDLVDDARAVLRTLVVSEREVKTSDERWFAVKIIPYRTLDNRIAGVVITFAEITADKRVRAELAAAYAELAARPSRSPDNPNGAPVDDKGSS